MKTLKVSGYNEKDRESILMTGMRTYSKLTEQEITGDRPFFRSAAYKLNNKKCSKKSKSRTWFQKDGKSDQYKSVVFVEATPGDRLLKMLRDTEEKYKISDDYRIKFVAKSGVKLRDILQRKNPLKDKCDDKKCNICEQNIENLNGIRNHKCRKNNVVYEAKCNNCDHEGKDRLYHGETARNLYTRSKEHYNALRNQNQNSFMHKHIQKEHENNPENVSFSWKVIGQFKKPLSRQLFEAIKIDKKEESVNLNSKSEYFRHNMKKIIINNSDFQCNSCARKFQADNELKVHEQMVHTRLKCKSCNYISFGEYDLQNHNKTAHNMSHS